MDGSRQKHGIDYNETFAPTARMDTAKLFLSIAALMDFYLKQMDVTSAFTNAKLKEDVYMYAPRGGYGKSKLCKLLTSLYGLKQAPRTWYEKLCTSLMEDYGFERSAVDPCLFRLWRPASNDGET